MEKELDKREEELIKYMDEKKKLEYPESYLIAILHKAQELYGYLSKEIMLKIAYYMKIPTSHIWGVATFYHYFKLKPIGKYVISICLGTACYVKGAQLILDKLKEELKINIGETTEDMLFTLQEARCLGACGLAPVIMINEKIYGDLTPEKISEIIKEIRKKEKKLQSNVAKN
ncbi:MAG TPA: NADH-quinone oxidoreductase subunit NuoE [bacterium]|nr:NADH-quinone oxidoreductase subunit NuoE [bacterium]HPQ19382.1 NADH-quinone oxidoreductase subunit NuoE [bacterium]